MKNNKSRLMYLLAFAVILLVEIYIALFVKDRFIRPYGGDILITVLLCCLVRIFIPEKCRLLPLWVFVFSVVVEAMQYFNIVKLLGVSHITFFRVLVGTSFSWADIFCYAGGCFLFFAADLLFKKSKTDRQ